MNAIKLVDKAFALDAAKGLISEPDYNLEYVRGICELLADLFCFLEEAGEGHPVNSAAVAKEIGCSPEAIMKMWGI